MANLPKQVQAQLDAADQMFKTPEPAADQATQAQLETADPAPAPAPQPAEPAPAPAPAPASDEDNRYKVLQGKYNSEVPALHAQNRQLTEQMRQVLAEVERLRAQAEATPDPAPTPRAPEGATAKDIDDFGSEMVAMVQRVTGSVVAELAARFDAEMRNLRSELGVVNTRQKLTAEQQFHKDLLDAVPDWQDIDVEDGWLTWLAEADPVSGQVRQLLLNAAGESQDARRVAAIFNAYKATKPAVTPPAAPKVTDPALAKQVAPSKASTPAPASTSETAQYWTDAAIQAFYDDVRKGKFKGRDDEYQRIDSDLTAAIAEGRYRPR